MASLTATYPVVVQWQALGLEALLLGDELRVVEANTTSLVQRLLHRPRLYKGALRIMCQSGL
jgi:hypothetical protein